MLASLKAILLLELQTLMSEHEYRLAFSYSQTLACSNFAFDKNCKTSSLKCEVLINDQKKIDCPSPQAAPMLTREIEYSHIDKGGLVVCLPDQCLPLTVILNSLRSFVTSGGRLTLPTRPQLLVGWLVGRMILQI